MMPGRSRAALLPLIFCCWICGTALTVSANESVVSPDPPTANVTPHFYVRGYTVEGILLSTNILTPLFSKYTGTNVSLEEIIKAASDLQSAYRDQGYPAMTVAFVPEQISDGIVTFNVAQTAIPQIVVAGERCLSFSNGLEIVSRPKVAAPKPPAVPGTNVVSLTPMNTVPLAANLATRRATYQEMVDAMTALHLKMDELEIQTRDTRVHVVSTNTGPRFEVKKYQVNGNTILPSAAVGQAITNIDGAFGTNVGFDGIETVVTELGKAYHERGYVTVAVNVPQQKLTNATVKLQVLEGRLADIKVAGNRYFSSNNVMRSLPSLHTNMVLNGPIFNAELNRANANQDRQIYPVIGPGPAPGTSELTLNVKDRLPFHFKLEFNNQNSPGTPDMRVNTSAVYDNLWQLEHSLGVQYGFAPEVYKKGNQWNSYDQPIVAYYSGFYRLPLGNPEPIENVVANNPGSFGYSEATRQFRLPPPSGQPELTLYASRATIDTGLENLSSSTIFAAPNNIFTISQQEVQQGITVNEAAGFRLTKPLPETDNVRSTLSGGLDLKRYSQNNYKTNSFITSEVTFDQNGNPLPPLVTTVPSPITTLSTLDYLPLQLEYDASVQDAFGPATWGLGLSANLWYSSAYSSATGSTNVPTLHDLAGLTNITGSAQSTGHWVILRPSFSQQFQIYTNWITSFRADGQWASEPVISPEQFGAGGVNSVRGYHEGEVFGDTGWHLSLEQQTPPYVVGMIRDNTPLTVRGSIYMDYARVYLIDPEGRQGSTPLCGTGFGMAASAGSHWQAQFLFSWPLLSAGSTTAYQPFFNFSLTAQF
ncbi:MAG TPA: POTRA domain-containing protein [Candidatus Limnocylindrales bacterium]|nr:POTRA domain-containing protein [Candidatus Limnocylindrales bacterium]